MKSRQEISGIQVLPAISILLAVIIISLVLGVTDAQDDLAAKQAQYCELRGIYEATDSEYGWPKLQGYEECDYD
jgi:hypothetical protein